ncbi:MAG: hypothetical protein ABSG98_00495 [Anaerolineales bacterium]
MPEFGLDSTSISKAMKGKEGWRVLNASLETINVLGEGGFYSPHLCLPMSVGSQSPLEGLFLLPIEITAQLFLGNVGNIPLPVDKLISSTRLIVNPLQSQMLLRLPLTQQQLARVEEARGGKDLELTLYLQAMIVIKSEGDGIFKDIDYASGRCSLSIPRSHWVDHILPALGYMTKYLLEISVPSAPQFQPQFAEAIKEFAEAQGEFQRDNSSGALVNCRNAINAFVSTIPLELQGQPATFPNRVEAFCTQQLQPRVASETKVHFVETQLNALWSLLSAETKPGPFVSDRNIAMYVLSTTASLLTFLGRVLAA